MKEGLPNPQVYLNFLLRSEINLKAGAKYLYSSQSYKSEEMVKLT